VTMSESKIEISVSLGDVYSALVGLDRNRRGLGTKDANDVESAANVHPAPVQLAPQREGDFSSHSRVKRGKWIVAL
jgi:hypothetical protein